MRIPAVRFRFFHAPIRMRWKFAIVNVVVVVAMLIMLFTLDFSGRYTQTSLFEDAAGKDGVCAHLPLDILTPDAHRRSYKSLDMSSTSTRRP